MWISIDGLIEEFFHAWERRLVSRTKDRVVRPFEWGLEWIDSNGHMNLAYYVVVFDLATEVASTDSGGMVLADEDPATGVPRTLYETVRNADALLAIDLPTDPGLTPHVRHSTPLPVSPGELVRLRRPGTTDLLAVAAQRSGVVDIFDVAQDQVVAKVERLGVLAREALDELRSLILGLRPPDLERDGLEGALRKEIEMLGRRFTFESGTLIRLPPPAAVLRRNVQRPRTEKDRHGHNSCRPICRNPRPRRRETDLWHRRRQP